MFAYFDYVLLAIPLSLLLISSTLVTAGVVWTTAVPAAGVVAAALVGHALFVNGPVDAPARADGRDADPNPVSSQ